MLTNILLIFDIIFNIIYLYVIIDITERINGNVDINGRGKEDFGSRGLSRAHKIAPVETRGEISEENTKENQE